MSQAHDEAYSEICEELKRVRKKLLNQEERAYVLGLLKSHLEYYERLSQNPKASAESKKKLVFLERLWTKLV